MAWVLPTIAPLTFSVPNKAQAETQMMGRSLSSGNAIKAMDARHRVRSAIAPDWELLQSCLGPFTALFYVRLSLEAKMKRDESL